jgi:two-component system, NarL family, nitrate/nitrite response regulator NarL
VRALIADDHAPTRAHIRELLEDEGFEICAEVGTASAAVDAALVHRPDVCLLDIRMPGSGISAAARIAKALPDTAVVMLTVSREETDLFDALRAGAIGFLPKETNPRRLTAALRGAIRGEAVLPRTLTARVIEEFRGREQRRLRIPGRDSARLTGREWEVLDLMQRGFSTAEIAARLFVSQVTVRTHIAAILRKLHVPDRDSALRLMGDVSTSDEKSQRNRG